MMLNMLPKVMFGESMKTQLSVGEYRGGFMIRTQNSKQHYCWQSV